MQLRLKRHYYSAHYVRYVKLCLLIRRARFWVLFCCAVFAWLSSEAIQHNCIYHKIANNYFAI